MSMVFEHGAIIDRINETKTVEAIIKKNINNQKAHAIVIWADSGYGKSAIMQKVMVSLNNQSIHVIIVDTPPTNTTTPIEGQYLNYIAEAINTALQDEFPIESFLYSSQSVVQPMIDSDQIIQSGHTLQSGAIAKIGNIMLSDLKARRLLYDTSVDSIIVLRDYIESTLRLFPIVLDITNAQNMDSTSFRIIKNILQNIPKIVIAFEYTTKDNDSQDMIRFVTDLNCPYTTIEINELPFDFALSIFGVPDDPNKILEIERFYKDVVKGNLYRIMQAKADSKGNGILYCEDPIEKKIQSLNYSNKLVLYILCLHDGELALSTFTDIISFVTDYFYISESWKNDLDSLILLTQDHIKLRHASIKDAQPMSLDNAVAMTAYRYLVLYYENLKNSSRDHNIQKQSVIWLVRLHSYFDPIRMIPLLEEFKQVVICNLSEIDAFLMIKQAFDALGEKIETEYHYRLIALCYEAGFYRGALTLLNELGEITTECGKTYMCMLLNRNDYHQEAISKCQLFLKTVKNLRYRMILLMVKMLSERSLGLYKSYISTFYEIERKQEFKSLLEYGFLLRNAQIVLSYSDSLPYLQQSIDFFNQRDEKTYMAHSQLTYLIQAARLGYTELSAKLLDDIAPILLNTSFEKHMVYLNQAAIRLLQGVADKHTRMLLDKALVTVTTVFDRIVVLNNMLCALIINATPSDQFQPLMKKIITELKNEPDFRLRKKVYTNIYLYYHMVGNKKQSDYWRSQACSVGDSKKTKLIENTYLLKETPSVDMSFLATQPCCIGFITYWHFDIPLLGF